VSRSLRTYSYSIGACLALLMAFSIRHGAPTLPLSKFAPLLAMAIVGEEIVVLQRQRSGNPALSFSAPAHFAAAILLGPLPAAWVAVGGIIVADGLRPASRRFLVLNASMFGLAAWAASTVYHSGSGVPGDLVHPSSPALLAILGLLATRYVVTSLILGGGYVLVTERSPAFVLGETFAGELGSSIGEGSLGVLIAIAFLPGHWIVLLLVLPLVLALYRAKAIFEQLKKETQEALDAVATVIDERHPTTAEHTERVAGLVRRFVVALQLPDAAADRLVLAARFHDIGKIAVDAATLSKVGRLTDEELAGIRRHPRLSARLLSPFHFAREIARYVEYHHERFDGRGYYSIANHDIPIESHVLIAADSFDAMTSPRPYRPALTAEEAVGELLDKSGTQFHPQIARAFAAIILEEPLGSALNAEEIRSLRAQLSRRPLKLPSRLRSPDWRLAATILGSLALALVRVPGVPTAVPATIAGASLLSAGFWLVKFVTFRRRRRLAQNALDAGASVDVTLATSGIANGFAWLEPDPANVGHNITSSGGNITSEELAEARDWANRGRDSVRTDLSNGCRLVLSAASGLDPRLAIVLDRDTPPAVEELCERICATAAYGHHDNPVRLVALSNVRELHRTVALAVELGGFEAVRTAAGHLVANRMVADAERRLRSLLRESDEIQRLGDDRFRIVVQLRNEQDAESVKARINAELSKLELPRRTSPLTPRVELTDLDAAAGGGV
jgi:HD domain/Diguanylate cyclase, GGDEF domain